MVTDTLSGGPNRLRDFLPAFLFHSIFYSREKNTRRTQALSLYLATFQKLFVPQSNEYFERCIPRPIDKQRISDSAYQFRNPDHMEFVCEPPPVLL